MPKEAHWPFLDGLRGLAILLVIPHNINAFSGTDDIERIPAIISHAGWIGVQIFFVLSGFLITHQLLRDRGSENYFSSFYMRRALRIFPLYYVALIAGLLIVPNVLTLSQEKVQTFTQSPWLWVFLNNWTQPFHGPVYLFSHFWSLAVEEQFYLIWPLVVLWCTRGKWLLMVCGGIIVVALICRFLAWALHLPEYAVYMLTVCRMDALAIGAAAAYLTPYVRSHLEDWRIANLGWWLCVATITVCALLTHVFDLSDPITITIGYLLVSLVTGGLMLICMDSRSLLPAITRGMLSVTWLRSVGRYSYGMYVIHFPLLLLAGPAIRENLGRVGLGGDFGFVTGIVAITYLLGVASYYLLEQHFLKLKPRFAARRDLAHASTSGS